MARLPSPSPSSTLSCINVSMDASELPSSTPPTSVTDAGSSCSNSFVQDNNGRAKRSRASMVNYNENVLSGRGIRNQQGRKSNSVQEAAAGTTLDLDAHKLVQDSIEVLNVEWSIDTKLAVHEKEVVAVKRSIRSRMGGDSAFMKKAALAMSSTKTTLGKRGRDALDAGMDKVRDMGRRASLRVRQQAVKEDEAPPAKKPKVDDESNTIKVVASTQTTRKPVKLPSSKRWLAQGLYVGQDPDFDPRMTDTKNKLKKAASAKIPTKQRKILPLPMFAGKRLLDMGRPFQLPYDVFNPLPNGQPKPDEWRKVGKNKFVGDAGEIWRHTKLTEMSTCLCTPEAGCDDDCLNRTMFYECDNSNCNLTADTCGNRSFEDLRKRVKAGGKYNIGVEVVKTKDKGYGVRSNRTFEPQQIIVEYTGEIITPEECDMRMYNEYKDNECFYLMVFDQNMIIDATRGSIARFVNHSCEPNCKMVKWTVSGKPRMALFAGPKGVMTGEELTYDYNFDPFSSKNIQECHCGKPSCRGVLGRKQPKDVKVALEPITNTKTSTKRKLQDAIEGVSGSSGNYKKRKTAVAISVKKAISSVKATASKQLTKAVAQQNRAKTKKGHAKVQSRLNTNGTISVAAVKKHVGATGTMKRGVVRTVKGKTAGRGKTIRVI